MVHDKISKILIIFCMAFIFCPVHKLSAKSEDKEDCKTIQSCMLSAEKYQKGIGVAQNPQLAMKFYEQACDEDGATACEIIGDAYSTGTLSLKKDLKKSVNYLDDACDLKNGSACYKLGLKYFIGEGVSKDLERAAELFENGCDYNSSAACMNFADCYKDGRGVSQ